MQPTPHLARLSSWPFWMAICLYSLPARSQVQAVDFSRAMLSPSGYTGAINTPTAHVQDLGVANLSWVNNNPEYARTISQGSFGSVLGGMGLLPGLEVVGRLAYEGDLSCNMYKSNCAAGARDLSLSAKYQLPWHLGPNTRMAVGMSDFGGAATNFRQVYGVATTAWYDFEASLGYSNASSPQALMNGVFGNLRFALSPQWHLLAEHDTQAARAGLQFQYPLGDRASILAGYSKRWSNASGQNDQQLQMAWVFHTDRTSPRASKTTRLNVTAADGSALPTRTASLSSTASGDSVHPAHVQPSATPVAGVAAVSPASAHDLAQALQAQGFANVQVAYWPSQAQQAGVWQISAEPRAYRQSQIEALGHALRPWLEAVRQKRIAASDQIHLTLTYQRQPVLNAFGQGECLSQWAQGAACAGEQTPLFISRNPIAAAQNALRRDAALAQTAQASAGASWAPQITLSPALRNTLGTEYGLVDYSLAAQVGTEIALAPGLFWQGIYVVPVSNSDDYKTGKAFSEWGYTQSQWHSSQLTYWKPLAHGVSAQISAGQVAPGQTGAQWDALWMSGDGRVRLGATGGRYRNDQTHRDLNPLYAQARYSIVPGAWHAEVTGGQFMNGDRGYKLASVHWFGDTRLAVHYQKSGNTDVPSWPSRAFMGFNVSFPLGPKTATALGPVWLRGQDRWGWGVQTKVGESDNYLTQGYADTSRPRHGLWSDVTDHDRNGDMDLQAQWPRLRALLGTGAR